MQPNPTHESTGLLEGLTDEQRRAATFGSEPVLVVAGAGTGKTATLAHRVAWLISQGIEPGRILLLTFSRRASAEMLGRVESLLRASGRDGGGVSAAGQHSSGTRVWGGTFHAVGARLLRLHARDIGMEPDFTIVDRADAEDLMHLCRTELGLGRGGKRFPTKSTCLDIYSRCVNARAPLGDILRASFPWCRHAEEDLKRLFAAYTDRKEASRVLDYDDLLLFWHGLLDDPAAGDRIRERFDAVLVDEYQDTNALQADIVEMLRPGGDGVTCVGDDAQAIYSFRAATVRNILDFEERYPAGHVLTLTRNFRSTAPILASTNAIIAEATERREKELWTKREGGGPPSLVSCRDEAEQTSWLVDTVLDHREQGTKLMHQAVLFRAQHHSMALEMELTRRAVPFRKYGGLRFIEMAHVKDLVATLRLAENPRDETAGLRVLGLVPGIGPATASKLFARLQQGGGDFEAWVGVDVPPAATETWLQLVSLMRSLAGAGESDLSPQVHAARSVLAPLVEQRYDNSTARLHDLEQLEALASRSPNRARFLSELALDPPSWAQELAGPPVLDEDWLVLSTMHSAKGLEFDAVYVIHAADGNIPSDMATGSIEEIDEERRLFYVACTRAKRHLYVSHPLRYYKEPFGTRDAYGYSQRTRFISDAVLPHFYSITAGPEDLAAEDTPTAGATEAASARIRASVRAIWE